VTSPIESGTEAAFRDELTSWPRHGTVSARRVRSMVCTSWMREHGLGCRRSVRSPRHGLVPGSRHERHDAVATEVGAFGMGARSRGEPGGVGRWRSDARARVWMASLGSIRRGHRGEPMQACCPPKSVVVVVRDDPNATRPSPRFVRASPRPRLPGCWTATWGGGVGVVGRNATAQWRPRGCAQPGGVAPGVAPSALNATSSVRGVSTWTTRPRAITAHDGTIGAHPRPAPCALGTSGWIATGRPDGGRNRPTALRDLPVVGLRRRRSRDRTRGRAVSRGAGRADGGGPLWVSRRSGTAARWRSPCAARCPRCGCPVRARYQVGIGGVRSDPAGRDSARTARRCGPDHRSTTRWGEPWPSPSHPTHDRRARLGPSS